MWLCPVSQGFGNPFPPEFSRWATNRHSRKSFDLWEMKIGRLAYAWVIGRPIRDLFCGGRHNTHG